MFRIFIICQLILCCVVGISAQFRQIAITIDDLPLNGPQFEAKRLKKMTAKLLSATQKHRVPVVGFVNEGLLYRENETDARIAILKMWPEAGVELGNHTFSHPGFKDTSLTEFQDDFIRGESVTKMLIRPNKIRYFRHPFLQMGSTRELEEAFQKFIAERGYRAVPVTVDTMDWMFLAAYFKALQEKDKELRKQVSDDYLKFAGARIDAAEKTSNELFGRNIKHLLLLHANELNADNFEALLGVLTSKGYQFITVDEALKDEVYRFPDRYAPTSDWLSHWAFSLGKKIENPQPPEYIQKIYQGK